MLVILMILCSVTLNNPTYNYLVQNDKLNSSLLVTDKDIQWLDKNTIQIKSGPDLFNNLTLNLN